MWGESELSENPYQSRSNAAKTSEGSSPTTHPANAAYNVVSDTVTGVNVRWSDNRFQAIVVTISMLILSFFGAALAALNSQWNLPWYGGALAGAFAGLVVGVFGSGIFLMVYRAVRHLKGKHD